LILATLLAAGKPKLREDFGFQVQPLGKAMLPITSRLKYFYFAYFSQPVADRAIYRAIHRCRIRKIVEIGVGLGRRAVRMIDLAKCHHKATEVRYTGIDLFEARPGSAPMGLPLKQMHRLLSAMAVRAQLVPGDPLAALARVANSLQETDLVIISADQDDRSLARAWFYLPRILHKQSQVFLETADPHSGQTLLRIVDRAEIDVRAAMRGRREAA
jgi:hypothetical protein